MTFLIGIGVGVAIAPKAKGAVTEEKRSFEKGGSAMSPDRDVLAELLAWVDERVEDEVAHRPDVNIYKETLQITWGQVRRKVSEMMLDDAARSR